MPETWPTCPCAGEPWLTQYPARVDGLALEPRTPLRHCRAISNPRAVTQATCAKCVPMMMYDALVAARTEMAWMASLYDDHKTTDALAQDLYDVSCTAKRDLPQIDAALAAVREVRGE